MRPPVRSTWHRWCHGCDRASCRVERHGAQRVLDAARHLLGQARIAHAHFLRRMPIGPLGLAADGSRRRSRRSPRGRPRSDSAAPRWATARETAAALGVDDDAAERHSSTGEGDVPRRQRGPWRAVAAGLRAARGCRGRRVVVVMSQLPKKAEAGFRPVENSRPGRRASPMGLRASIVSSQGVPDRKSPKRHMSFILVRRCSPSACSSRRARAGPRRRRAGYPHGNVSVGSSRCT